MLKVKLFLNRIGIDDPERYILIYFVASLVLSFVFLIAYMFVNSISLKILFLSLSISLLLFSIFFPYVRYLKIREDVENILPEFVVYLSCLYSSKIDTKFVLEAVSKSKYFGYLSDIFERIKNLVYKWKFEFSSVIKRISDRVPSERLRTFLDRFSISYSTFADMEHFFDTEREFMLEFYVEKYNKSLERISLLRDIYIALYVVTVFVYVLAMILPYLIEINYFLLFLIPSSLVICITIITTLLVFSITPPDKIFKKPTFIESKELKKLERITRNTVLLSFLIFVLLVILKLVDLRTAITISIIPLFYPGVYAFSIERKILRKDKVFPNFIRVFGSVLRATSRSFEKALEIVLPYDFRDLNEHILKLYRRVRLRLNVKSSWIITTEETLSNFIKKLSIVFYDAIDNGADPEKTGNIIAKFSEKMLILRDKKLERAREYFMGFTTIIFVGTLALYLGLGSMKIMNFIVKSSIYPLMEEVPEIKEYLPFAFQEIPIENFNLTFFVTLTIQAFILSYSISLIRGTFWQCSLKYFVIWVIMVYILSSLLSGFFSGFVQSLLK